MRARVAGISRVLTVSSAGRTECGGDGTVRQSGLKKQDKAATLRQCERLDKQYRGPKIWSARHFPVSRRPRAAADASIHTSGLCSYIGRTKAGGSAM